MEARYTAQEAAMVRTDQAIRDGGGDLRTAMQAMDERIDRRFDGVERRFDTMDRKFHWLLAVQVTTLVTLVAAAFSLIR
jgi:hypothetical protein